jgi:outer membrane protein assembly factor BamB
MRSGDATLHSPRSGVIVGAGSLVGVLLGVALAWAVSSGVFGSRPHPGRLLSLDVATGAVRFDVAAETASVHLHGVDDGLNLATGADDCGAPPHHEEAYAYSVTSGALRWHRRMPGTCVSDTAVQGNSEAYPAKTAEGVTITGTPPGANSNTASYIARDRRTGRILWRKERRTTIDDRTGQLKAISDGLALFVQPATGKVEAFALRSGTLRWTRIVPSWEPNGFSQLVAGSGFVAVLSQRELVVLDAARGSTQWSTPLSVAGIYEQPPAMIYGRQLLIPSNSTAYAPLGE